MGGERMIFYVGPRPSRGATVLKLALAFALLGACLCSASGAEFSPASPLPQGFSGHTLLYSGGYLYNIGGLSDQDGVFSARKVYYTRAQAGGTLGDWTQGESLPEAVFFHAGAAWNGVLYVIGGYHFTDSLQASGAVYYSKPGADGSPSPWMSAAPLPEPLFLHSAAVWQGILYVTGGWGQNALSGKVYSARIRADGSLDPWVPLLSLPEAVYTHASVSDGTIYVLGGVVHQGTEIQDTVHYSRILPDGTLEGWQATTPLPEPVSNHASIVADGKVFSLGGWTGIAPTSAAVVAPILSDKTLGEWSVFSSLPTPLYMHSAAVGGDVLYVSGGSDGTRSRADVYALPILTKPTATVVFHPDRLNLLSMGNYVDCEIEFSAASGARASDIDPDSVRIVRVNGRDVPPLAAADRAARVNDDDGDGLPELKMKFPRHAFALLLASGDNRVGLEGRLRGGTLFTGEGALWAHAPVFSGTRRQRFLGRAASRAAFLSDLRLSTRSALGMVDLAGGKVRSPSRSGVDVPAGAVEGACVTVSVPPVPAAAENERRERSRSARALIGVGEGVEFGPEGQRFAQPVTLILSYDPARLPPATDESSLQIHYWNKERGEWEALSSRVDRAEHVVRAETSHFSLYQVMGGGESAAAPAAEGSFSFGEVYAFPNPARRGRAPTLHVEAGTAQRLDIRIYDLSGELVHSATLAGPAALVDDGSGRGGVSAFEYPWDVSGKGSGVYIYVVTAHKDGFGSLRKSGKLAVVK